MKIDEINFEILKKLQKGRKSFKEISDELSVSENTVRTRVNRLIDEGLLEITGLVNPIRPSPDCQRTAARAHGSPAGHRGMRATTLWGRTT